MNNEARSQKEAFVEYRYNREGQLVLKGVITGCFHIPGVYAIETEDFKEFEWFCEHYEIENRPPKECIKYLLKPPSNSILPFDWDSCPEITRELIKGYQRDAVNRIVQEFDGKGLIACPPGKGKSLIASLAVRHYGLRTLILTTKNTVEPFINELKKWADIDATECLGYNSEGGFVTVSNYESAVKNDWILSQKWQAIVFDESSKIKNSQTQWTKTFVRMAMKARMVLMISATPRSKCNSELYTQLLPLLGVPVLGTKTEFLKRYCSAKMGRTFGTLRLIPYRNRYKGELHALLSKCSIRLDPEDTKLDVELNQYKLHFELPNTQQRVDVDKLRLQYLNEKDTDEKMKLSQKLWIRTSMLKMHFVVEHIRTWLKEHPGEKLVVYFHHQKVLEKIKAMLTAENQTFAVIDGKTSKKKRDKIVQQLRSVDDQTIRVGLLSFGTCSMGITLCPGVSTIIFAQLIYVVTLLEQCAGKVYRLGQTRDCYVIWPIAKDSYDTEIMNSLARKKKENGEVMDGKEQVLLFTDENETRKSKWFVKKVRLTQEEADRVKISPLPKETIEQFLIRSSERIGIEEYIHLATNGIRSIQTEYVDRLLVVKTQLGGAFEPVVILKPFPKQRLMHEFIPGIKAPPPPPHNNNIKRARH